MNNKLNNYFNSYNTIYFFCEGKTEKLLIQKIKKELFTIKNRSSIKIKVYCSTTGHPTSGRKINSFIKNKIKSNILNHYGKLYIVTLNDKPEFTEKQSLKIANKIILMNPSIDYYIAKAAGIKVIVSETTNEIKKKISNNYPNKIEYMELDWNILLESGEFGKFIYKIINYRESIVDKRKIKK